MDSKSKNCAIATLESSLDVIKAKAGVSTLPEVETALSELRAAFDADPSGTAETAIREVWDALKALELDNFYNISRVWWQLSGYATQIDGPDAVWLRNADGTLEYSTDDRVNWKNTFTPDAHQHPVAEISDFPGTMPPDAHQHPVAEISDFPATMPPDTHQHPVSDISDFPAEMPPEVHSHIESVEWIGDGTFPRTINLSGNLIPEGMMIWLTGVLTGEGLAFWDTNLGSQIVAHNTTTTTVVVVPDEISSVSEESFTVATINISGVRHLAIIWGRKA